MLLKIGHSLDESFEARYLPSSANSKLKTRHLPPLFSSNIFLPSCCGLPIFSTKLRCCCLKLQCRAKHLSRTHSKVAAESVPFPPPLFHEYHLSLCLLWNISALGPALPFSLRKPLNAICNSITCHMLPRRHRRQFCGPASQVCTG